MHKTSLGVWILNTGFSIFLGLLMYLKIVWGALQNVMGKSDNN